MRRHRAFRLAGATILVALAFPQAGSARAGSSQADPAHTGFVASHLSRSLHRVWTRRFRGGVYVSYPVSDGRRAFFILHRFTRPRGTFLVALSTRFGRTLWRRRVSGDVTASDPAYSHGRVYFSDYHGRAGAYAARTGHRLWRVNSHHWGSQKEPVAAGNLVFFEDYFGITVRNARNGKRVRRLSFPGGVGEVAVARGTVFLPFSCSATRAFSLTLAFRRWFFHPRDCDITSGDSASAYAGRVYNTEGGGAANGIFDARSGRLIGRYRAASAPAFAGGLGFGLDSGITAFNARTGRRRWHRGNHLFSPPLVVGHRVYAVGSYSIARGSFLDSFDRTTGRRVQKIRLGPNISDGNPLAAGAGLAYADGRLLVPWCNAVAAFR